MPTTVKLALSVAVIVLGAGCAWLERTYGEITVSWVIVGLVAFMVLALWLFPEAGVKDGEQQRSNAGDQ